VSEHNLLKTAHHICRKATQELWPQEIGLFESVWDALQPTFAGWVKQEPSQWTKDLFAIAPSPSYRWPQEVDLDRLILPRATAAMVAAFIQLAKETPVVNRSQIETVAARCAEVFGVRLPLSDFAQAVAPLLEADLRRLSQPLVWPVPKFLYLYDWKDGRCQITEEKVRSLEQPVMLRQCDLFLDVRKPKFWLGEEERRITVQVARLCAFVLKRVGGTYQRNEVEEELWPGETVNDTQYYRAFDRLYTTTGGLLKKYLDHVHGALYTEVKDGLHFRLVDEE